MKKRSREINVFSVSALDLFASALGAFILMSLIFMVFFTMTARDAEQAEPVQAAVPECEAPAPVAIPVPEPAQCDAVEVALQQCEAQVASSVPAAELAQCDAERAALAEQLRQTFVLVIASWSSTDDVDLHVVDPLGREYYYADDTHPGSPASLAEDNVNGPGNEVWLHPSADPGRYLVCYKLYSGTPAPTVRGSILWQEGQIDVPDVSLTADDQVRIAIEIIVDADGIVSVDRSRSQQVLAGDGCA